MAGVGLVATILVLLLGVTPVENLIRDALFAATVSRLDVEVSVDRFELYPWRLGFLFEGLELRSRGEGAPDLSLTVDRIAGTVSASGRVRAEITAPALTLVLRAGEDGSEPPAPGAILEALRVERLHIAGGRLLVQRRTGAQPEPLAELEVSSVLVERTLPEHFAVETSSFLRLSDARGGWMDLGELDARATILGDRLRVARARLERRDLQVSLRGELRRLTELTGDLEVDFHLGAALAGELRPELELRGDIDGEAAVELRGDRIRIEADLRSAALGWENLGPWRAEGALLVDEEQIELGSGILEGYGGVARLAGSWNLTSQEQRLEVAWSEVDLIRLAADLSGTTLPARARSSGDLEIATRSWQSDTVTGSGRLSVQGDVGQTRTPLRGQVSARLDSAAVEIPAGEVSLGQGRLVSGGRIDPRGGLSADYRLRWLDLGDLAPLPELLGTARPPVEVRGAIDLEGDLRGTVREPRFTVRLDEEEVFVGGEAVVLEGEAQGDVDALELRRLGGRVAGGRFVVSGTLPWSGGSALDLRLDVEAVDLCAVASAEASPVCGILHAAGALSGPLADPRWTLRGAVESLRARPPAGAELEEVGRLAFSARRTEDGLVVVDNLQGSLAGGELDATGRYDLRAEALETDFRVSDLELRPLLEALGITAELAGELDLEGSFQGPASAPAGAATFSLRDMALEGRALPDLSGSVTATGSGVVAIEAAGSRGGLQLSGSVDTKAPYILVGRAGLDEAPSELLELLLEKLAAPRHIAEPVLRGSLAFELPLTEPRQLTYRGTIDRLAGRYGTRELEAEAFAFAGDWEGTQVESLRLRGEALDLTVDGRVPFTTGGPLDVSAGGVLPLGLLAAGALELDGSASIEARIAGTWRSPRLAGEVRVEESQGRFRELEWQAMSLDARFDQQLLELRKLSGQLLGGTIQAAGALVLDDVVSPQAPPLDLRFQQVDLTLLAEERPAAPSEYFLVSGSASLRIPLFDPWMMQGTATLESVRAGVRGNEMQSLQPATLGFADGRVQLERLELAGGGTDLDISLSSDLEPPFEDLLARVEGAIDLSQLGFVPASLPGLEIGGLGSLDMTVRGGAEGLTMEGSGSLQNGRIASTNPRFFLSDLHGEVAFRDSAIRLRNLRGRLGGGTVEAHASISLESLSELESVVLEAEVEQASLNFGEGIRGRVSGDAVFQGRGDRYRIKGDFRLLSGLFTREIDAATSERDFLSGVRAELREAETAPFADTVELDIRLASIGDLFVDNELIRVTAGGNLRVEGTLANPELSGVVTTTREGNLVLGRNTFNLQSARITLDSYPVQPAHLDIVAEAEIAGSSVRLELTGTPDDIETHLSSPDPRLTQGDLASLLVTGRTSEAAPEATGSIVEARAASYLGELFQEQLGLGLVFDTPATLPILASETDPESRFTVGRRLSDKLTVAYSIGMEDAETQLWIIDYQPLRRFWFRAIEEGGEAFTFEIAQRLSFELGAGTAAGSPTRPRVGSVEVMPLGGDDALPEPATRQIPLDEGDRYDYWRAEDAAAKLRRRLEQAGYLGARVDVEASAGEEGLVDVRFAVDPGPEVRFEWRGDDAGEELRRRIERRWVGRLPSGLMASDLAQQATRELESRRYYQAQVTARVEASDNVQRVVFDVHRGERGKGVVIAFTGNTVLSQDELVDLLPEPDDPRFFAWTGEDRRRLEDALAVHYAEEGYLDLLVEDVAKTYDEESGKLRVTLSIEEGARYTVDEIVVSGAESLPREQLLASLDVREGETFTLEAYRRVARQARRLYRDQGFPEAQVRSRVRRDVESTIDVILTVEEGVPAEVGQIFVSGNERTTERVIRRQLDLETGEPLRPSELAAAERELYKLGAFRSVEVRWREPPPGERRRDIEVRVVEKPDLFLDYGLRYRTDDVESLRPTVDEVKTKGPEGVARLQLLQPFRRGGSMTFSLFGSSDRQRGRVGYQFPHFFGRFLPTEIAFEADTQELQRLGLESSSATLTLQQRREPGRNLRLLYGLQLQQGRFDSVGEPRPSPVRLGEDFSLNRLSSTLVHDVRDHVMNPRRGSLSSVTLQLGSTLIGADFDFVRLYAQYSVFVPLGDSARSPVWASSYRAGAIFSDEPFIEFQDGFTAGGPFSVRGFATNTLGPTFAPTGDPLGGQGALIFNQELRFPLWGDLWGGVFYDAGNVFSLPRDLDLGELRQSYGLGLRYDIGFGVIRADLAKVVDPRPGEAQERLHLSFGHAF